MVASQEVRHCDHSYLTVLVRPEEIPQVGQTEHTCPQTSNALPLRARQPCLAHLDGFDLHGVDRRGVVFEDRQVGVLAFLQASGDIVHPALPGGVDRDPPERSLDRNALLRNEHPTTLVHDAGDGVLDTAKRTDVGDVVIR